MPSINGFTISPNPAAIGVKTYTVPGTAVRLAVRSEIAPLLIGAATEFNQTVEPLHPGWNWGYAYRPIRGRSTPSFHSGGLAIDLNAPKHPLGTSPSRNFTPAQIAQARRIARKYGLRWGGDYSGRKDGMHFEVILPRAQAVALARRIQTPRASRPAPAPRPTPAPRRKEWYEMAGEVDRILEAVHHDTGQLIYGDGAKVRPEDNTHPFNLRTVKEQNDSIINLLERIATKLGA